MRTKSTLPISCGAIFRVAVSQGLLVIIFVLGIAPQLWAQGGQGVLDNPQPNSVQSGIGLINGWVCDAEEVLPTCFQRAEKRLLVQVVIRAITTCTQSDRLSRL